MVLVIGKHFEFEASHQLPPDKVCYGKCRQMHGHTYKLTVEIEGEPNEEGWLCNFTDLKTIVMDLVVNKLDHSNLNDHIVDVTTAENIVMWIANRIEAPIERLGVKLSKITLYETSNSFAALQFPANHIVGKLKVLSTEQLEEDMEYLKPEPTPEQENIISSEEEEKEAKN